MNLYYVRHSREDDDFDQSLLVEATSPGEAAEMWIKHFDLDEDAEPFYVGLVPLGGHGPIDWGKIIPEGWEP